MSVPPASVLLVTPDHRNRRRPLKNKLALPAEVRIRPSSDDIHTVVFFRRHLDDDPARSTPGREALESYPTKVRATMRAVMAAVANAPPKRFSGGGYWEAMKGDMTGWFEIRVDGPKRRHYRLFCLLDYDAKDPSGLRPQSLLAIITGLDKEFRTTLRDLDYAEVKKLGDEYWSRNPRSVQ
jgi:hypothetical protein